MKKTNPKIELQLIGSQHKRRIFFACIILLMQNVFAAEEKCDSLFWKVKNIDIIPGKLKSSSTIYVNASVEANLSKYLPLNDNEFVGMQYARGEIKKYIQSCKEKDDSSRINFSKRMLVISNASIHAFEIQEENEWKKIDTNNTESVTEFSKRYPHGRYQLVTQERLVTISRDEKRKSSAQQQIIEDQKLIDFNNAIKSTKVQEIKKYIEKLGNGKYAEILYARIDSLIDFEEQVKLDKILTTDDTDQILQFQHQCTSVERAKMAKQRIAEIGFRNAIINTKQAIYSGDMDVIQKYIDQYGPSFKIIVDSLELRNNDLKKLDALIPDMGIWNFNCYELMYCRFFSSNVNDSLFSGKSKIQGIFVDDLLWKDGIASELPQKEEFEKTDAFNARLSAYIKDVKNARGTFFDGLLKKYSSVITSLNTGGLGSTADVYNIQLLAYDADNETYSILYKKRGQDNYDTGVIACKPAQGKRLKLQTHDLTAKMNLYRSPWQTKDLIISAEILGETYTFEELKETPIVRTKFKDFPIYSIAPIDSGRIKNGYGFASPRHASHSLVQLNASLL